MTQNKSLRNVSNRQFLSNPYLVRKYGMFGDADKDAVINLADCYPFNKYKHGIISNVRSSVGGIVTGVKSIFTGKSAYQQEKESAEKRFEGLRPPAGTTAEVTAEGKIIYVPKVSSGGTGGGYVGDVTTSEGLLQLEESQRQEILRQQVQARVESQRQAEIKAQKVIEQQRAFYTRQAERELQRYVNLQNVSPSIREKIIQTEIGKVEPQYRKSVEDYAIDLIKREEQRKLNEQQEQEKELREKDYDERISAIQRRIDKELIFAGKFPIFKPIILKDIEILEIFKQNLELEGQTGFSSEDIYRGEVRETSFADLFKTGQFPKIVLKGFYGAGKGVVGISEKIRTSPVFKGRLGGELTPEQRTGIEEFIGETFLWSAFTPMMKTTGQQLKNVFPQKNDILFRGVSQKTEEGITETQLQFLTTKGQTGRATGYTIQKEISELPVETSLKIKGGIITKIENVPVDLTISETLAKGKVSVHRGLEFPTGRIVTKFKTFKGVELGISKSFGSREVQVSKGLIKVGKEKVASYESLGIAQRIKDEWTFLTGGTLGEREYGMYAGAIKDIGEKELLFDITTKGMPKYAIASKQSMQGVANIVQSALKEQIITKPLGVAELTLPIVSALKVIPPTKVKLSITSQAIKEPSNQVKEITKQIPSLTIKDLTRSSIKNIYASATPQKEREMQKTIQSLQELQRSRQAQKQIQNVVTLQKTKQVLSLKQVQLQQQKPTNQLFTHLSLHFPQIKEKGRIIPRYIPYKTKPLRLQTPSFSVAVRRGKKFRTIGIFKTYKEAFYTGKRRVEQTLAASFKISGLPQTPQIPKGFYLSRKEPRVFIEKRGRRLKRGTFEIPEIQRAKRIKMNNLIY